MCWTKEIWICGVGHLVHHDDVPDSARCPAADMKETQTGMVRRARCMRKLEIVTRDVARTEAPLFKADSFQNIPRRITLGDVEMDEM